LLLIGPSGSGKSHFARVLAERAGAETVKFIGSAPLKEVVERLSQTKHGDVVFFDECHKLPPDVQELLFEVIDGNAIPARLLPSAAGKEPVPIAPVTLVFATDRPGKLLNALHKRIPSTVCFERYPEGEMKEIVARVAERRSLLLSPQAARRLAKACNGLPRRAEHHVQKLRLFFSDSPW
jgi:Holliday junction DNA helicase RuvB